MTGASTCSRAASTRVELMQQIISRQTSDVISDVPDSAWSPAQDPGFASSFDYFLRTVSADRRQSEASG